MDYWYHRKQTFQGEFKLQEPLKARTQNVKALPDTKNFLERGAKSVQAYFKSYSSLRHYGKYNQLTAYGSVFNAENIVKIAKGEKSQYEGWFDGHVVNCASDTDFVTKVQSLIDIECPVIVPFDVGVVQASSGDPTNESGKQAHWAVIFGTFKESSVEYAIHWHWGEFRYSELASFAASNGQLTANCFLNFTKVQYTYVSAATKETIVKRDYVSDSTLAKIKQGVTAGNYTNADLQLRPTVLNYEFCAPISVQSLKAELGKGSNPGVVDKALNAELIKANGFDPHNLGNAGLKGKFVAIYPGEASTEVRAVVPA
jgi:hypothetical protein